MKLPTKLTRTVSRAILKTQKNSPQILFVGGVVGVVATAILASKATLHLEEVLGETNAEFFAAAETREIHGDRYSEQQYLQDRVKIWTKGAVAVGRLYAPSIVVGSLSIGALTGSHVILQRRNTGLMAAYAALDQAHREYRERVREEYGDEKELHLAHGTEPKADGKKGSVQPQVVPGRSPYARFFDEYSQNWERNPELNHVFLTHIQNYMNDRLRAKGHVFLNEVYDQLGLDRTQAGAIVGWISGPDSEGNNYIDFGLYDDRASSRAFVNGREASILLDFNVDGVIYDKLPDRPGGLSV